MVDHRPDEDLTERVAQLETTLEALRAELEDPPRGPLGLPRPPTPRELLRVTDQHVIPTSIAILEATIRSLELLQRALRLAEPERTARGGAADLRTRTEELSRETLERLDDALAELQSALEGGSLPRNPEARSIVEDARRLNEEVRDRLASVEDGHANGRGEVDVDSELQSIKDELEPENENENENEDSGP